MKIDNITSWISQNIVTNHAMNRSSHRRCSLRKGVLRNFAKFTGKHLCQSLFFHKVAGLSPATLLNMWLWHRCLPVIFPKFLRTPFLQNTSWRLLLNLHYGRFFFFFFFEFTNVLIEKHTKIKEMSITSAKLSYQYWKLAWSWVLWLSTP